MEIAVAILRESWRIFEDSSVYVLFGLMVAGMLKVFLSPGAVARHLGRGRFAPVIKAALLGIPLPLCCCGVLPAAAGLKKQGASTGATTSFLISTPETGVDSLAVTYALMDPVMTVARPLAAFATAAATGLAQGLAEERDAAPPAEEASGLACAVDSCCDGLDCPPEEHSRHHTLGQKLRAGVSFAVGELWGDMASWFMAGLLLTGVITVLVPEEIISRYLGGGVGSMLAMLLVGIPIYICASASTPIAAALVLKGVSPGAALVFLLAGPATNLTALTVLWKLLGRKATAIYLAGIAVCSVLAGLALDAVYQGLGLQPRALMGQAAELMPDWARLAGALALLALSLPLVWRRLRPSAAPAQDCCAPSGAAAGGAAGSMAGAPT